VLAGLARLGVDPSQLGRSGTAIPDVTKLPAPVAAVVQAAYGHGVAHIFLIAAPLMLLAVVAVASIKEVPLRRQSGTELNDQFERAGAAGEVSGAPVEHVASSTT
jgi:hypothetical protein